MKKDSKFLSLILRHKPETIGITLDSEGWVGVDVLLRALNKHSNDSWDRKKLDNIVENNDKKRFVIDKLNRIRASQGHSIEINIKYDEVVPNGDLYHGTVNKFVDSIYKEGLKKMNRHHVHLSSDLQTAEKVGSRRGKPVILKIDAQKMYNDGFIFYISDNGVWLTNNVPPQYILNPIFEDNK